MAGLALASLAYALDRCCTYAQERRQFADQPIGRFQRVQDVILDMDIALEQGLTWLLHLVRQYDADTLHREAAAKVKIECSRRASLLPLAMEMCGGVACLDEFGLVRHWRDLFVCRVGEGSNFALKTLATRPDAAYSGHVAVAREQRHDDGRVHNFNPGPAALPLPVLEQVQSNCSTLLALVCLFWR